MEGVGWLLSNVEWILLLTFLLHFKFSTWIEVGKNVEKNSVAKPPFSRPLNT